MIIGNCSLALAPVKPDAREKLAGMLSYVEAIPMDVLKAGVPWTWESFPEYMSAIGQRLGVNVGTLVGHSAVRLYAMGEECSDRDATDGRARRRCARLVRESLEAGALGLSITRNMNHFDIAGKRIPAACAPESELFALADVLREVGTGVIQCGGGTNPELKDRLLSRISQACGRPVMYNTLLEQARAARAVEGRTSPTSRRRRAGHPRDPALQPRQRRQPLHDEELPGVPGHADLAADPAGRRRGEARAPTRDSGDAREAPRRGRRAARRRTRPSPSAGT